MIRDVFDPTAIPGELIFCHHVFKFTPVKLSKSPLLGDMDLLTAGELEPGPEEGLSYMLLVLQLGAEGHDDLANVNPGHYVLGLSKVPAHTLSGAWIGVGMPVRNVPWRGLSSGSLEQPVQAKAVYPTEAAVAMVLDMHSSYRVSCSL